MCGLTGIASPARSGHELGPIAQKMVNALAHRGPDSQAVRTYEQLALGHARLSIIDTSAGSNQPMVSSCGRYHIVYNGEVYNYLELREECARLGYVFASAGDTEAILACVATQGIEKTLPKLRGMFCFALYDTLAGTIHIARDRFGQKPCYYTRTGKGELAFASEVKAVLASGLARKDALRTNALLEYFFLGSNTHETTVYEDISELRAGHYATYNLKDGAFSISRYAPETRSAITRDSKIGFGEALEQLDSILTESIRLHLRSDVGAALFLSGGIDSGLIAGISAKLGYPLHTFTIGTGNSHYDESSAAAAIAQHTGLTHQIVKIDENIARDVNAIYATYDEPIADPSIIPTYYVTQAGARYSKVFLTGDGGDEIFLGYRRYRAALMRDMLAPLDTAAMRALCGRLSGIIPASNLPHAPLALLRRMLLGLSHSKKEQLLDYFVQGLTLPEMQSMASPGQGDAIAGVYAGIFPVDMDRRFLDLTQTLDIDYQLPDTLLVKMDMASMRHSIETRAPFLDNEVAAFAFGLPAKFHVTPGTGKRLLRALARRYLPEATANMPKKGFEIPIADLLEGQLAPLMRESVLDSTQGILQGIFTRESLETLVFNKNGLPRMQWARKLWLVYAFSMWEKTRT